MPSGKLGAAQLGPANTWVVLFTAEADRITTAAVNLVNIGNADTTVDLAVGTGGAPAAADFLEFGFRLAPNSTPLERTGIAMSAGERCFVRASIANAVAVRAHGFVEDI